MAALVYGCNSCDFVEEYNTSPSLPISFRPPEDLKCPKCKTGDLIKDYVKSVNGISFDVIGGYDHEYGKKAWKRNNTLAQQADILAGTRNPY